MIESKLTMSCEASVNRGSSISFAPVRSTHYKVDCIRKGELIWTEEFDNIVVNEGLNDSLYKHLKGSAYTAAWYVGLAGTGSKVAGDTAAEIGGTNAWSEVTNYTQGVRQTLTLGSVSGQSVDNSLNKASFTINTTITIYGAFVVSSSVKNGTSGVLYGVGDFGSSKDCESGDVLILSITCSVAAS